MAKEFIISTVCSGIGSPEQALTNLNVPHKIGFACEIDKHARQTYLANFTPGFMVNDMTKEEWSGPEFYSDLFVGGIPCQAFSLAGLRKGELDPRGLLFYDFYRYVKKQQPKAFIIENVKGLLSDSNGKTFQNWVHLLGQSLNGHLNMFNSPDSCMYNLHFKVLNCKNYGLPQNRERVFLVGIHSDMPNSFHFPKSVKLTKKLKDLLEIEVDPKYFLSDTALAYLNKDSTNGWSDRLSILNKDSNETAGCITANHSKGVPYNMLELVLVAKPQRTERAKQQRRETGTNSHSDKQVLFEPSEIANCVLTNMDKSQLIKVGELPTTYESAGRIYDDSGISKTIVASPDGGQGVKSGIYLIENKIRRLTPLECMRLQGFPDHFNKPVSETQQYKQAGNSIPVAMIQAIIKNILPIIVNT